MEFKVQKITKTEKVTDEVNIVYDTTMEATTGYDKVTVKQHDQCSFKRGEKWELKCIEKQKELKK